MQVVALSIAGSDSSGGAGIQADLRAFFDFGVYGSSVITAVTAQNPHEVSSVFALPESEVVAQISAVMKALEVKAVKTGMLFSSSIIEGVAKELGKHKGLFLVIDPVMVSTSGARLIDEQAIETLRAKLLPLATLVTPNLAEAEVLSGEKITSRESLIKVGRFLSAKYGVNFLIKGGHGSGFEAVDMLFEVGEERIGEYSLPRLENYLSNHGSGCSLSAAIAANLGKGESLERAIWLAKEWVHQAIGNAVQIGNTSYGMWPKSK